jgi:predicted RND superfamily exporter protein
MGIERCPPNIRGVIYLFGRDTVAITVFFASQLHKTRMDNNFIAFLPKDDPARIVNRHLETEYGEEITILVGLERPLRHDL